MTSVRRASLLMAVPFVIAFTVASARAQAPRNWGTEWRAADPAARWFFVSGLQLGNMALHRVEGALTGTIPSEELDSAVSKLSPTQKSAMARGVGRVFERLAIERAGADVIERVVSEFYREASNSFIPWDSMAEVAVAKVGGASTSQTERRLAILREVAVRAAPR